MLTCSGVGVDDLRNMEACNLSMLLQQQAMFTAALRTVLDCYETDDKLQFELRPGGSERSRKFKQSIRALSLGCNRTVSQKFIEQMVKMVQSGRLDASGNLF